MTRLLFVAIAFCLMTADPAGAQCWLQISNGLHQTLALRADGTLWGWGQQYNNGFAGDVNTPTQIGVDANWLQVSSGESGSVALNTAGKITFFGLNQFG